MNRPEPSLHRSAVDIAPPQAGLTFRRLTFAALVAATVAKLMLVMVAALAPGGFSVLDAVMLVLLAAMLPWSAIGLWNALIGFIIMRLSRDPVALVTPPVRRIKGDEAILARTALVMCVRNESTIRVFGNLLRLMDDLYPTGSASRFPVYILSDTNDPEYAREEEAATAALRARYHDAFTVIYRRRADNIGFKAGNIREFLETRGHEVDFMVTLDADSLMSAERILRMVRIMQASPELGILQNLITGLPSASAFTRLFQFGMRLGMRSYTIGSAWWQADCGPYWGHNAVIRVAPFRDHCHLPTLPGKPPLGGEILSHDQVEAVFMRRAGYEVRVLPEEGGSYEENPTTLIEFVRRDLRWCQGNMQYLKLLRLPGIKPVSRAQLVLAVLMFISQPAWVALVAVATARLAFESGPVFAAGPAIMVWASIIMMAYAPRWATLIDVLLRPRLRRQFGGGARAIVSTGLEAIFSMALWAIMAFAHTRVMLAFVSGRSVGWDSQARDAVGVPWDLASRNLWRHTIAGAVVAIGLFLSGSPGAIWMGLAVAGGCLMAIPFAVWTADPAWGAAMARAHLAAIPEEIEPPDEVDALDLQAVRYAQGEE